jgi:putative flippase GtrA
MEMINSIYLKFFKFALVSGIGVTIDFLCVWLLLTFFNAPAFYANCLGSVLGITFVFFTSSHKVFVNNGRLIIVKFLVYLAYSAALIFCVSSFIHGLSVYQPFVNLIVSLKAGIAHPAIIAKMLITPFTLLINFIAARFLIEKITI